MRSWTIRGSLRLTGCFSINDTPVTLMSDDLDRSGQAIRLSRTALRIIRQNLALLTVGALLLGGLFGYVDMAGGMRIQQLPVLLVVINGLRLMRTDVRSSGRKEASFTKRLADAARTCECTVTDLVIVTGPSRS